MSVLPETAVVVGVDGTVASTAALSWAAAEAAAHRAPLVIVRVLDPRSRTAVYSSADAGRDAAVDAEVMREIKELVDQPDAGPVEQVFEIGVPSRVLAHHARSARMLVLGQAAHHAKAVGEEYRHEPALGAVARACVAEAQCPVVVVPEPVAPMSPATSEPPSRRAPIPRRSGDLSVPGAHPGGTRLIP